jgi:hypothetical protein
MALQKSRSRVGILPFNKIEQLDMLGERPLHMIRLRTKPITNCSHLCGERLTRGVEEWIGRKIEKDLMKIAIGT